MEVTCRYTLQILHIQCFFFIHYIITYLHLLGNTIYSVREYIICFTYTCLKSGKEVNIQPAVQSFIQLNMIIRIDLSDHEVCTNRQLSFSVLYFVVAHIDSIIVILKCVEMPYIVIRIRPLFHILFNPLLFDVECLEVP